MCLQDPAHKRDVLREDLLLQRFRRRRDDDLAATQYRWDQVSERLSCSRARFDKEWSVLGKRFFYGFRHRDLPRPRLIGVKRGCERGVKDVADGKHG